MPITDKIRNFFWLISRRLGIKQADWNLMIFWIILIGILTLLGYSTR